MKIRFNHTSKKYVITTDDDIQINGYMTDTFPQMKQLLKAMKRRAKIVKRVK